MKAEVHRRAGTATSTADSDLQKVQRSQDALSLMPLFPSLTGEFNTNSFFILGTRIDLFP